VEWHICDCPETVAAALLHAMTLARCLCAMLRAVILAKESLTDETQ
jgi:hypothetical protein